MSRRHFSFFQINPKAIEGRPEHEKDDCTVIALMNALGVPYLEAHRIAHEAGRPHGQGFRTEKILRWCAMFRCTNYTVRHLMCIRLDCGYSHNTIYPTLARVLTTLPPNGRYILRVKKHVFAVVNGTVMDPEPISMRKRVTHIFEIEA